MSTPNDIAVDRHPATTAISRYDSSLNVQNIQPTTPTGESSEHGEGGYAVSTSKTPSGPMPAASTEKVGEDKSVFVHLAECVSPHSIMSLARTLDLLTETRVNVPGTNHVDSEGVEGRVFYVRDILDGEAPTAKQTVSTPAIRTHLRHTFRDIAIELDYPTQSELIKKYSSISTGYVSEILSWTGHITTLTSNIDNRYIEYPEEIQHLEGPVRDWIRESEQDLLAPPHMTVVDTQLNNQSLRYEDPDDPSTLVGLESYQNPVIAPRAYGIACICLNLSDLNGVSYKEVHRQSREDFNRSAAAPSLSMQENELIVGCSLLILIDSALQNKIASDDAEGDGEAAATPESGPDETDANEIPTERINFLARQLGLS